MSAALSREKYLSSLQQLPPDDLIPCLVHDVRNRVNAIKAAVALMKEYPQKPVGDEEVAQLLSVIESSANDLRSMADASLDFHRLQEDGG